MSRIWYGIVLLCFAGVSAAQVPAGPGGQGGPEIGDQAGQGTDPDVRHGAGDPRAVEIPLYAGALISDVLSSLTAKGFRIKWSAEQVLPSMKLLERPKSTRIDNLLNEILAPWGMRADHNLQDGGYRVKPVKKKRKD
ncbi:MAG TPA: hypothetical protein VK624_03890 [Steroidobacteraceae bacterium]|nr:hypothetical protein [Steroidobacteraceae bacterium]